MCDNYSKKRMLSFAYSKSDKDASEKLYKEMLNCDEELKKLSHNSKIFFPAVKTTVGVIEYLDFLIENEYKIKGYDKYFSELEYISIVLQNIHIVYTEKEILNIHKHYEIGYSKKTKKIREQSRKLGFSKDLPENNELRITIEFFLMVFSSNYFKQNNKTIYNKLEKLIVEWMFSEDYEKWILKAREYTEKYLGVSKAESKINGEIFSPKTLINEMLDVLPKDFWEKPRKILDPSSGISNFGIEIINRFMVGLQKYEPNEEKRKKLIVEEILYQCELEPKNVFLNYHIIDHENNFKIKIFRGSFLSKDNKKLNPLIISKFKEWGIDKFDLIVANPPYNNEGGLKTGGKNLYQKFIINSLDIYSKYILFVCPPGFYKATDFDNSNNIYKKISSNEHSLEYLNATDINKQFFNVGSLIIYFLIKKQTYTKTKILTDDGILNIDMSKYNFIPRLVSKYTYSILEKIISNGERMEIFRDDNQRKSVSDFVTLSTLNHLSDKGYWNISIGSSTNRKRIVINCDNKNYKAEELLNLLNLKLYRFCFYVYRHDGAVYHNFIKGFNIPKKFTKDWTDKDLYKYFNLSQEEIDLIESTIKN
jgi:N-6 DNA methylase